MVAFVLIGTLANAPAGQVLMENYVTNVEMVMIIIQVVKLCYVVPQMMQTLQLKMHHAFFHSNIMEKHIILAQ